MAWWDVCGLSQLPFRAGESKALSHTAHFLGAADTAKELTFCIHTADGVARDDFTLEADDVFDVLGDV